MMSVPRISLGITGGIGSGKSYFCRILEQRGIPVFYADDVARNEMLTNSGIHSALEQLVGHGVLLADGSLNKPLLSSYVSESDGQAQSVNAIVHPQVRLKLRQWIESQSAPLVAVECALLFEAGFAREVSLSVLVTAPTETRIQRVMARDGKTKDEILRWMSLQMPEEEKKHYADYIVVNDGETSLYAQMDSLMRSVITYKNSLP